MLIDLEQWDGATSVHADVAIVGGGAAGLSLATQLRSLGKSVVVLEGGGSDFEEATQALYAGADLGMPYYPLADSRLRFLGGTTNIWGGRSVPLQPIDFEVRDWVPYSGWPLSYQDLEPHYQQAHAALELGEFDYSEALWSQLTTHSPDFDEARFTSMFWRFDDQRERFASLVGKALGDDPDCQVYLHANVTHLAASADADALTGITASSLGGRRITVTAGSYVLASGAIENARLLLASRDVEANGVGNRHDQVGRYFMEHPHARLATLSSEDPQTTYALWSAYRKRFGQAGTDAGSDGVSIAPVLLPSRELQSREKILNTGLTFKLQRPVDRGAALNRRLYLSLKHQLNPTRTGRTLWQSYRSGKALLQRTVRNRFELARIKAGLTDLHVMVRAEQAPNPLSRVLLSDGKDALGTPRADLNWQLNAQDTHTLQVLARVLGEEFTRLGLGQLEQADWLAAIAPGEVSAWPVDPSVGNHPIGGYHHMGTTRMSSDQTAGVVDADCRVHNYANLYIAGSSVFPTGGWANPTLTILALAHRLGQQLGGDPRR